MSNHMVVLKDKLKIIIDFIEDKNDVILIDYPLHDNGGDWLIFAGTLQFCINNKINIKRMYNAFNLNLKTLKKITTSKTTFLLQGGGNFGDLYLSHEHARKKIIENFPNNQIILLPQTSFFKDSNYMNESIALYNKHSKIVMFARDLKTSETFMKFTDKVFLLPDMAHELYGSLKINSNIACKEFYFIREDIEVNEEQNTLNIDGEKTFDWNNLSNFYKKKFIRSLVVSNKLGFYLKNDTLDQVLSSIWTKYLISETNRFSYLFSSYEKIITSRMHGHILACLVNRQTVLIDNSYGKNLSYYECWTKEIPTVTFYKT